MIAMFNTPAGSTTVILLTIAYGIFASITTFDIRIIQAKKNGILSPEEPMLPKWVSLIYWLEWIVFFIIIFLNWKFGIIIFVSKFILKVLPVLETIGNIIMSPFKKNKNKN